MKIYKIQPFGPYNGQITGKHVIPAGFKIVHVGDQQGVISIWFMCNPENCLQLVEFEYFGTGGDIDMDNREYIGTVCCPKGLVWHVFINHK